MVEVLEVSKLGSQQESIVSRQVAHIALACGGSRCWGRSQPDQRVAGRPVPKPGGIKEQGGGVDAQRLGVLASDLPAGRSIELRELSEAGLVAVWNWLWETSGAPFNCSSWLLASLWARPTRLLPCLQRLERIFAEPDPDIGWNRRPEPEWGVIHSKTDRNRCREGSDFHRRRDVVGG